VRLFKVLRSRTCLPTVADSGRLGHTTSLTNSRRSKAPRVLEPLLVVGRLLPALVGLAGADQVHVGAKVFPVLARLVAGAVGAQAEVLGHQLFGGTAGLVDEVPTLEPGFPTLGIEFRNAPEALPVGQRPGRYRGWKASVVAGRRFHG